MRNLKILALLLVALAVASESAAQGRTKTVINTDSTTVITTVRVLPRFYPKHDLRVGVGAANFTTSMVADPEQWFDYDTQTSFRENMERADTYCTPRIFIGSYSLSYTYYDRRWLQYGGTVSFTGSTCWRKDSVTGDKIKNLSYYSLAVVPTVRFIWYYREKVQLYSSLSLGVITSFDSVSVTGDATLLGCSFGGRLFGFVELGAGIMGSTRVGIGYRFDATKKSKK